MKLIAYSLEANVLQSILHEISQVWGIVVVFALIGLVLGLFLTRKGRREFKRYARENRELLDQYRALRDEPKPH